MIIYEFTRCKTPEIASDVYFLGTKFQMPQKASSPVIIHVDDKEETPAPPWRWYVRLGMTWRTPGISAKQQQTQILLRII